MYRLLCFTLHLLIGRVKVQAKISTDLCISVILRGVSPVIDKVILVIDELLRF
jgi:hypothetical protein